MKRVASGAMMFVLVLLLIQTACFAQGKLVQDIQNDPRSPVQLLDTRTDVFDQGNGTNNALKLFVQFENYGDRSVTQLKVEWKLYNAKGKLIDDFVQDISSDIRSLESQSAIVEKSGDFKTANKIVASVVMVRYDDGRMWVASE